MIIKAKLDHLILGIDDLTKGSLLFEELTGVKPAFGGTHPAYGTQNSLVSIDQGVYLEIIAPQNDRLKLTGPFKGYDLMKTLTPCGWAISCNLLQMEDLLNKLSIPNTGIQEGSRKKENGQLLKWQTLFMTKSGEATINPFFLQWDPNSIHPSQTEPKGCNILNWVVNNIESKSVQQVLNSLDISLQFKKGSNSGWLSVLNLDTPKGAVLFQ